MENDTLFLSFSSISASTFTSAPTVDGTKCFNVILKPTLVCSEESSGAKSCLAQFSIIATKAGVANTSKSPEPIFNAVCSSLT